jgi:predicted transcriptional regulator of viral defense system
MKKRKFAGLSTLERKILSHFSALETLTITADDLIKLKSHNRETANLILSRLALKGWLLRLKQGVYMIVPLSSSTSSPMIENVLPLAMVLFKPAFISGWTAAEHWNLTEQIFNSISVVTLTPQRKNIQIIGNVKYRVRVLHRDQFFGFKTIWLGSNYFDIADPSRTIIDILDLPRFGGGTRNVIDIFKAYWHSEFCDPNLLLEYATQYKRGSVFKRLGYLAEKLDAPVSKNWYQICEKNISKGISFLDPDGAKSGDIISKWHLQINIPI